MTRVDSIPILLRPLFLLYGWGFGSFLFLFSLINHFTCTIRFEGEDLKAHPQYILCIWHDRLVPFFSVFVNMDNQIWMNHPAWYMKPIHVLLKLTGVKEICLGSSGNSGKEALTNVIRLLKQGYSTSIASDGPAGPNHVLKPGALLMSRDAGIPVIPLTFTCSHSFRLGGWDRKIVPLPFSEIVVKAGKAIYVTDENLKTSSDIVTAQLNENQ